MARDQRSHRGRAHRIRCAASCRSAHSCASICGRCAPRWPLSAPLRRGDLRGSSRAAGSARMSEPKIRPMAAADLKVVVAIADSLATAPHWPRSAYEAALDPAGVPPRIALVAEVSGIIAGLAIASLIPPQAELETIAISQPFK